MFGSSCRKARRLFSPLLDEHLAEASRRMVMDHIAGCPGCSERLASLRLALHQARLLETVEVDAGFEATVLAALPVPPTPLPPVEALGSGVTGAGRELVAGPSEHLRPRRRHRLVPPLGVGLAAAAALVAGILLRDLVPGFSFAPGSDASPGEIALSSSGPDTPGPGGEDLGSEVARGLASVRGSLVDYLGDSRDVFLQLASLEGKAPREEVRLARDELDYSNIGPKTARLRQIVFGVDLAEKDDVIHYLDSTRELVCDLRLVVESGRPSPDKVDRVRHMVLDSGILHTIQNLHHSFTTIPFEGSRTAVETFEVGESPGQSTFTFRLSDEEDEYSLYRQGRELYFARDYAGASRCFQEHAKRFPASPLRSWAEYSRCRAALRIGDLDSAVDGIEASGRLILSGQVKVDRPSREILQWFSVFPPAAGGSAVDGAGNLSRILTFRRGQRGTTDKRMDVTVVASSGDGFFFPEKQAIVVLPSDGPGDHRFIRLETKTEIQKLEQFADYFPAFVEMRLACIGKDGDEGALQFNFVSDDGSGAVSNEELVRALRQFGLDEIVQFVSTPHK